MERLACVDVPFLALQILLKQNPQWLDKPVAVIDEDRPQGRLLEVNKYARRSRILPGMRYAAALSLDRQLRAAEVEEEEIADATSDIQKILHDFSPQLEPGDDEPALFWLRMTGLDRLFGSFEAWSNQLHARLKEASYYAAVVVGFSRFGTYAIARSMRAGTRLFETASEEVDVSSVVPLARLDLPAKVRDALGDLGVETVGEFLALPAGGIRHRFGEEVHRLRRLASGEIAWPIQPLPRGEPICRTANFDPPEADTHRLVFCIKRDLHPMLLELASHDRSLARLDMKFRMEDGDILDGSVQPATPTLEESKILDLVRIRLEKLPFTAGVLSMELIARDTETRPRQTRLFANGARNFEAANQAIARLRTEFGERAVLRIVPHDHHLPQSRFRMEPMTTLEPPEIEEADAENDESEATDVGTVIRRIFDRPRPLPRYSPEIGSGWLIRTLDEGPVVETLGPYVLSGGWWEHEVHREYYYARTKRGDIFWIFYDRQRKQWFLQGTVE